MRQRRREQLSVRRKVAGPFFKRDDLDVSGVGPLLGARRPDATDMIRMDMGADHGADRLDPDPAKALDDRLGELDDR